LRRVQPVRAFWTLFPLLLAASCARAAQPRSELVVFAAASLRDALSELAPSAEEHCGTRLVFSFGSSGDLARQIVAADAADVFFSADERELERVEQAGRVLPDTRRTPLSNQLVVIEPLGLAPVFVEPFAPEQLLDSRVERLSLADTETVPAGRYARAWLERRGVWDALLARVLPGIDVRAALAAVEAGGARAGIVYRTDAAHSSEVRVVHAVPLEEGPEIVYALAALGGRAEPERARVLVEYLTSDAALEVFARHGFVPLGREH
jgi:molybdate transport system substrate-binding protein